MGYLLRDFGQMNGNAHIPQGFTFDVVVMGNYLAAIPHARYLLLRTKNILIVNIKWENGIY